MDQTFRIDEVAVRVSFLMLNPSLGRRIDSDGRRGELRSLEPGASSPLDH